MSTTQIRFFTLWRRELNRFLKIKKQTIGAPLLETFLYISVFGAALGSRIKTLHGFDYVVFVIPGLIMMAWAMNSFSNNASSILQQKFQGAIQDQLSSPASPLELLTAFSLRGKKDERTRTLSGGMKRRLILARALMHRPRLLILDEPTAGVDIELRLELWHYVRRINEEGTTILLTTHYLEEADELCDRIAFIGEGQIAATGTSDQLAERYGVTSLEDAYLELVGRKELSRAHIRDLAP